MAYRIRHSVCQSIREGLGKSFCLRPSSTYVAARTKLDTLFGRSLVILWKRVRRGIDGRWQSVEADAL